MTTDSVHRSYPDRAAWLQAALSLLALFTLAACGDAPRDAEPDRVATPAPPPGGAIPATAPVTDRPRALVDTTVIEGVEETVRLGLFRSPTGFPMPFSTYLPADMVAEWTGQGEDGVRFVANFGGRTDRNVFVHIVAREASVAQAELLARAYEGVDGNQLGGEMAPMADIADRYPWARGAYDIHYEVQDRHYNAVLLIAQHDRRLFQLVLHCPAEYADGFWPRADLILEHWRWQDGRVLGEGLRRGP